MVVDQINRGVTSHPLSLWHWDTDAHPNLHLVGPHGPINEWADIRAADLVIGVFWKRLGASICDSCSAIVSELRRAMAAEEGGPASGTVSSSSMRSYPPPHMPTGPPDTSGCWLLVVVLVVVGILVWLL